jgi:hypothetical protein
MAEGPEVKEETVQQPPADGAEDEVSRHSTSQCAVRTKKRRGHC